MSRVGDEVVLSWAPGLRRVLRLQGRTPRPLPGLQPGDRRLVAPVRAHRALTARRDALPRHRDGLHGRAGRRLGTGGAPTGGGIPLEQAALLGCAALTGVGAALFSAGVTPGSSVLVVGAGGVGQFVVQGARIAGAETIVATDPEPARREQAKALGATHAAHPDEFGGHARGRRPGRRRLRLRRSR